MTTVVEARIGKTTYKVNRDGNPQQVGGVDRFVVVHEGHPIHQERSNGQTFYVTYKDKRKARSTAINLTSQGMSCKVWDKEKQKVLDD